MLDAINRLHKEFPDAKYSQLRYAMENETKSEETRIHGRGKYERAVSVAEDRIRQWILGASEYQCGVAPCKGALDVTSTARLLQFVGSHRPACVWAVLFGMTRDKQAGVCNCKNCAMCGGEKVICGTCEMCTRCHSHKPGCKGCAMELSA